MSYNNSSPNGNRYFITCCTPTCPKRVPGCHGTCPDYAEAKAKYDADKAAYRPPAPIRQYDFNRY